MKPHSIGYISNSDNPKCIVINNKIYERKMVFRWEYDFSFLVGNYLEHLLAWDESPQGQWIISRSPKIIKHKIQNHDTFNDVIMIEAYLTSKDWTFYCLKFIDNSDR